MRKIIIVSWLVVLGNISLGQTSPMVTEHQEPVSIPGINPPVEEKGVSVELPVREQREIFVKTEISAAFPGGDAAFKSYLAKNLNTNVPISNNAPSGTYKVIIRFVVSNTGEVSEIMPQTSLGYGMEMEAVRVIKRSGKWNPAFQNGVQVNAYTSQAITFVVPEN